MRINDKKRSLQQWMRLLHRDIGFFVVGITIVFSVSGIVLIYRDTDTFKVEKQYTEQLSSYLDETGLKEEIGIKRVQVKSETDELIVFRSGTYNKNTGIARYTLKEYPYLLDKINFMHKAISSEVLHWFATIYGILLLFLAISSFWMYKPGTRLFKRGVFIGAIGFVFAVLLFLFWQ